MTVETTLSSIYEMLAEAEASRPAALAKAQIMLSRLAPTDPDEADAVGELAEMLAVEMGKPAGTP